MRLAAPVALALLLLAITPGAPAQQNIGDPAEDPANFTWEQQGVLAVGGGGLNATQVQWLAAQGFGAIADFREEHSDPADAIKAAGMEYLFIPVSHATDINVTELHTFLAWAHAQEAAGRPMYIHCTNGWHRAAAFAIAWEMERHGRSFDDAAKAVAARRPGTMIRAPGALLRLDAELRHKTPLTVMITSTSARPPNVTVEVYGNGAPVSDASVHLFAESGRVDARGTTSADGTVTFDYPAAGPNTFMDYINARASASGYDDGADSQEVFWGTSVGAPTGLSASARVTDTGIAIHITKGGGPLHARVLATSGTWSAFDQTPRPDLQLPRPPHGGAVTIRVASWGAGEVTTTLSLPSGGGTPSPGPTPAPTPPPAPSPAPAQASPPAPAPAPTPPPASASPPTSTAAPSPPPTGPIRSDGALVRGGIVALVLLAIAVGATQWRRVPAFRRR